MTIRITLDEVDFRTLVSGGIVKKLKPRNADLAPVAEVEIALSDIGWAAMRSAIHDAYRSAPDEPG